MSMSFEAATRALASDRLPAQEFSPSEGDSGFWGYNTSLWSSPDAPVVNERSALGLAPFWAGVTLICECIGSIEMKVYRKRADKKGRVWADQHPANWLLSKTNNGWMVPSVFKSMGQAALLLSGNFLGEVIRNGRGQAVKINPWLPRNVNYGIEYNGDPMYGVSMWTPQSDDIPIIWDRQRITTSKGIEWFPYSECIHVKAFSSDGRVGRSVMNMARQSIQLGLTIEQYEQRYFDQSKPSGFLTKAAQLSPEDRKILRQEFKEIHEGARKAFNVGVLSGGLDWKNMGFNNNDAQMLQSKEFEVLQQCRWLHIPPHMLADLSKATETNIEQLMLEFLIYCIGPWLRKWKEELDIKLFTPMEQFNYEVDFDLSSFLKADRKTMAEVNKTNLASGASTLDEVRIADGKEVYPDDLGAEPFMMASQLDTVRNVREGKSPLQQGGGKDPSQKTPAKD